MIRVRRSGERGRVDYGWLDTRHTFSFGEYYDPAHMGFRSLRVINEDRVVGGAGFPPHGHRDMEIVSYVVEGALEHKDSLGTGSIIRPGEVQRMSAGKGVMHSEYNPSQTEPMHFLQIWILPDALGLPPSYEQKAFPEAERTGSLRVLASPDGRDGSVTIHQNALLYGTLLAAGEKIVHAFGPGRAGWLQVIRGDLEVNGTRLSPGDGASLVDETQVTLQAATEVEALLFDLA